MAEYVKRQKGETIMSGLMILVVIGLLYKGVNTLLYASDGNSPEILIPRHRR
ncbi:MAG TPA: hypothetical protein VEK38_02295 [Candidatus Bathyarchaeia archaeon]|nr:hypothetical protein [Candidatus Bathyarchaeia archaeon]